MFSYCVRIAPHYTGQISVHFPDFPGLVVLGRDHDEARDLALAALEQELERLIRQEEAIPRPRARGPMTISTRKFS
jgi:predicted RNase H-like HicB family nuclease